MNPRSSTSGTIETLRLCALGAEVELVSDDPGLVAEVRARLGRFVAPGSGGRLVEVRLDPPPARVATERGVIELCEESGREQAFGVLFRELLDGIDGAIVLHAAALERDGTTLLLAGSSGSGKTTLTLALLERGFRLLSDDFTPLRREDGRVLPFLKAPGIRRGAATRLASRVDGAPEGASWRALDPDSLAEGSIATLPARVGGIVFLGGDGAPDPLAPYRFGVIAARDSQALASHFDGLTGVRVLGEQGAETLLEIDPRRASAAELDALFGELEPSLLEYGLVSEGLFPADTPSLVPVPPRHALLLLLREIQNRRPGGSLVATLDGGPAQLAEEVAGALGGAPAAWLRPASPEASAAFLEQTFETWLETS